MRHCDTRRAHHPRGRVLARSSPEASAQKEAPPFQRGAYAYLPADRLLVERGGALLHPLMIAQGEQNAKPD